MNLTIAIPTYLREQVLVETCGQVIAAMDPAVMELLLIDQTPRHDEAIERRLQAWQDEGRLRRVKSERPSLTRARNTALREARGDVVLFLDDDIVVPPALFQNHLRWYDDDAVAAVTGEVYNCLDPSCPPPLDQPGRNTYRHSGLDVPGPAKNTSGGNHSVRKSAALEAGGYDERFVGSALGEDMDFAQRLMATGGAIWYDPEAWIIHLGVKSGGCGVGGGAKLWPEWVHSGSLMLYAFRHGRRQRNFGRILWMALRNGPLRKEVVTRPWRWPEAAWGFLRGTVYGWRYRRAPAAMTSSSKGLHDAD